MAPRQPDDYLRISEVFHKTFLELDEKGTEAAAATAVVMMRVASAVGKKPEPIEVRVDHPFLFAIQHRPSGACLFLGRVTNPL
jgi:serpin B